MSTAVLEPIVEQPIAAQPAQQLTAAAAPAAASEEPKWSDPHPLLPVFVAGVISAIGSVAFIGAVVIWLAVRHSGIMAP